MSESSNPGGPGDDFRGSREERRKDETVMVNSENLSDMVQQAKEPAPTTPTEPAAAPSPSPAGAGTDEAGGPNMVLVIGVVLIIVIAIGFGMYKLL